MNHVHISLLSFLIAGAYLTIWNFFWSYAAARFSDRPIGEGMAFIG